MLSELTPREIVDLVLSLQETARSPLPTEADRVTALLSAYAQCRADVAGARPQPDPSPVAPAQNLPPYHEDNPARWENGFRQIVTYVQGPRAPFTIVEILDQVREMREIDERYGAALESLGRQITALSSEIAALMNHAGSPRQTDVVRARLEALTSIRTLLLTDSGVC